MVKSSVVSFFKKLYLGQLLYYCHNFYDNRYSFSDKDFRGRELRFWGRLKFTWGNSYIIAYF